MIFFPGIKNIEDLAAQKEVKYGTVRNSALTEFFKKQVTETYVTMYTFMEQYDTYVANTSVGLQMVQDSYGKPMSEFVAMSYEPYLTRNRNIICS